MLLSHPKDDVVQKGQTVEFSCQTNGTAPVHWTYRPHAAQSELDIFIAGSLVDGVEEKFAFESAGTVLILNNASMADSGTYTCIDRLGFGEKSSAELIVLGKNIDHPYHLRCNNKLFVKSFYCSQTLTEIKKQ